MSGVTYLALGLIKIDKSEHMCFTIYNRKNDNTQKGELKTNETMHYPTRLRHTIEKHNKSVFRNNIEKIKNYRVKLHIDRSVAPETQRKTMNSPSFA